MIILHHGAPRWVSFLRWLAWHLSQLCAAIHGQLEKFAVGSEDHDPEF